MNSEVNLSSSSLASSSEIINTDTISVRLTRDPVEIEAAQRLRYQVFYEEFAEAE